MQIISDLTNRDNIHAKAAELAELIASRRKQDSEHKIYIIAKSAGTVVALNALSQVGDDCVERAILLSPAVSPHYPLERVLRAVKQDVVSFWSPIDLFWLGLGTSLFGTADGVPCRAAGLVGFKMHAEHDYSKLRQVKWEPSMIRLFHLGGHPGNSMPPFLRKHIVPLLTPES
jgi:pimeloyl-ACP methyl ester carboxylesterase